MPFTIEEKRERKRIAYKKYYDANKEKESKRKKKYRENNIDKMNQRSKEYYKNNKELIKEQGKNNYQKNKEKVLKRSKDNYQKNKVNILKRHKEYRKTSKGKKSHTLSKWKLAGIIADNYDEWYEKYLSCNECNFCGKEFKNTKDKHLDHNHTINDCENIRGVLCCKCNIKDVFLDLLI